MKRLGSINQGNAEQLALGASTLLFSVAAVALGPELASASFTIRLAGAVLGAASLATVFLVLRRAFNHAWAKPLLGTWVYRTRPHGGSSRSDVGYGVAQFEQAPNGQLAYRVDLYRSGEDALAAAHGDAPFGESHGTAVGLALSFDEASGALWVLYRVEYYDDTEPDREGHLFVRAAGPTGYRVLRGSWASDLEGRELSAGVMTMMRSEDFAEFIARERESDGS